MTDQPAPTPAGEEPASDVTPPFAAAPSPAAPFTSAPMAPPYAAAGAAKVLPFSKLAIAGFVISCVSIFVFGVIGAVGVTLSARGFRDARRGVARGRGLAIAGMIIGTIGFLYYVVNFIFHAGNI
jgi:hypothetical protein